MKLLLLFVAMMGLQVGADQLTPQEARTLLAESPCMFAVPVVAPSAAGKISSKVYCIMERHTDGKLECVLTGYEIKERGFTPLPLTDVPEIVAGMSCSEGGVAALMQLPFSARKTVAERLSSATLLYSADESLLDMYFGEDGQGKANYLAELAPPPEAPIARGNQQRRGSPFAMRPRVQEESVIPGAALESASLESMSMSRGPEQSKIEIFYATDRNFTGNLADPSNAYGIDRNDTGELALGKYVVTIPKGHVRGNIEVNSIFRFEFSRDPRKHMMIESVVQTPSDQFFRDVSERVGKSSKKDAFVFIHGFNNTFENAALRAAQLAFDMNFEGAPILYTWPSGKGAFQYAVAEANAQWTRPHLYKFLRQVAEKTGAERVHLIGHSMGNRPLTDVLNDYSREGLRQMFHQVILAAPDVDRGVFEQIAAAVAGMARNVTVYASDEDKALMISRTIHKYPRLGDAINMFVSKLVDTIFARKCAGDLLGHSYFGADYRVLTDISEICDEGCRPAQRSQLENAGDYWVLRDPVPVK